MTKKVLTVLLVMVAVILSGWSSFQFPHESTTSVTSNNAGENETSRFVNNTHPGISYIVRARPSDQQAVGRTKVHGGDAPIFGNVELDIRILDKDGRPLDRASLDVIADHTAMNAMIIHPQVINQGNGVYVINTDFSMPGAWMVTFRVKNGDLEHLQDIVLKIL